MLTPCLARIKRRLEAKNEYRLSDDERELLNELKFLDGQSAMRPLREALEKSISIVSGPSTHCHCCGHPL